MPEEVSVFLGHKKSGGFSVYDFVVCLIAVLVKRGKVFFNLSEISDHIIVCKELGWYEPILKSFEDDKDFYKVILEAEIYGLIMPDDINNRNREYFQNIEGVLKANLAEKYEERLCMEGFLDCKNVVTKERILYYK